MAQQLTGPLPSGYCNDAREWLHGRVRALSAAATDADAQVLYVDEPAEPWRGDLMNAGDQRKRSPVSVKCQYPAWPSLSGFAQQQGLISANGRHRVHELLLAQ